MPKIRIALAAIFCLIGVSACSSSESGPLTRSSLDSNGTEAEIQLTDVESGEWSSALIVCPYQPEDIVEQKLGIDYPLDTRSDTVTRVVFASEENVIETVTVQTYEDANLCTVESPVMTRDSSLLLKKTDGWELEKVS